MPSQIGKEVVLWALENLSPEEQGRTLCPRCKGGNSKEKSLGVIRTETGLILWNCFRAKCGFKGLHSLGAYQKDEVIKTKPSRPFLGMLETLSGEHFDYFKKTYGLWPASLSQTVRWAPEEGRFSFGVLSPENRYRGTILRSFSGARPKALTYKERTEEPWQAWYGKGEVIVIVEDQLSAMKVGQAGGVGVALLGTSLNYSMVKEIADMTFEEIPTFIALDRGTMPLMLKYKNKYDSLFRQPLVVWKLEKDLKYESDESIKEALFGGKTDFTHQREAATGSGAGIKAQL